MSDIYDAIGDFNPEDVPKQSYEPVPAGWHQAYATGCEVVDTKAGTGKMLKTTFALVGPHDGRVLFSRINLANPNPKCVEIGQRELASLSRACEIAHPKDSSEFLDKVIEIKVVVTPGKDGGEPQNDIKGYRAVGGGATVPPTSRADSSAKPAASKPAEASKPAAQRKRPWDK
jgi:hypothetical protein